MIYFAYGVEMRRERMSELCPDARPLQVARLPHHALIFTGRSERSGGGSPTIGLATGRDLWGGLYEIDPDCRSRLEVWGGSAGYAWCWTDVHTADDDRVRAGLLVKVRDLDVTAPAPDDLEALKEAWREWGLDPEDLLRARMAEGD